MNVLFLTTHFNTGGITSYVLTLGGALVKSGHRVWVASSGGNCLPQLEAAGMHHLRINIRTKSEVHPKVYGCLAPLKHLMEEEQIDIIHAQTRVTQVLGFFLSRLTGVSMVTTCHGFFRPRWFRRAFPCWGDAVIAISRPVAAHLKEDFHVADNRIHGIPNGIDLERFKPADEERRRKARQKLGVQDGPLVGIIARLSDVKAIDVLIKSMPLVLKEMPSAKLVIAGQGPQEAALKKLTEDLNLTTHVHFKSIVDQAESLLPAFDVFVMPSLMEGLGLSVMEAQACGIAVVASSVGGLVDLIENGKTGYLVPSGDPQGLAQRIVELIQDPGRAKAMAKEARLNIEERFSAGKMLQETVRVYEQHSRR